MMIFVRLSEFSAYLWGIETRCQFVPLRCGAVRFQHTYEGLKLVPPPDASMYWYVFSIPMRDWNAICRAMLSVMVFCFQHTYEGLKPWMVAPAWISPSAVFSIPMRDWNYELRPHQCGPAWCFQHTYEGLKRWRAAIRKWWTWQSFQHTYEGLKQSKTTGGKVKWA